MRWVLALLLGCGLSAASAEDAQKHAWTGGRLLATGGASSIEGGAGGGIVPWAVLSGSGTADQWGGSAFVTRLELPDFELGAHGLALVAYNRLELSLARQKLRLDTLGPVLNLADPNLRMDIYGLKLRLAGDLIYEQWPQLSAGLQHKRHRDSAVPILVGARADRDTELYFSASRLVLAGAAGYNLILNGTLRYSRANQGGLLGFGGDRRNERSLYPEASVAVLLRSDFALGLEWRAHPDNLGFARQDAWSDLFVAWFPHKQLNLVAAWADLGSVAGLPDQRGLYLSLQLSP